MKPRLRLYGCQHARDQQRSVGGFSVFPSIVKPEFYFCHRCRFADFTCAISCGHVSQRVMGSAASPTAKLPDSPSELRSHQSISRLQHHLFRVLERGRRTKTACGFDERSRAGCGAGNARHNGSCLRIASSQWGRRSRFVGVAIRRGRPPQGVHPLDSSPPPAAKMRNTAASNSSPVRGEVSGRLEEVSGRRHR